MKTSRHLRTNSLLEIPPGGLSRQGFSLLDMVLTVLILGIVSAVASPRLASTVQFYYVDAAARRIEADINYVQSSARLTNSVCTLTFAAGTPTYTTTNVSHIDNSGRNYAVDLAALGYTVSLQTNIDGGRVVTYLPNGTPQAGSPLTALNSGVITITAGSQTRLVTIDPVTGKARRS